MRPRQKKARGLPGGMETIKLLLVTCWGTTEEWLCWGAGESCKEYSGAATQASIWNVNLLIVGIITNCLTSLCWCNWWHNAWITQIKDNLKDPGGNTVKRRGQVILPKILPPGKRNLKPLKVLIWWRTGKIRCRNTGNRGLFSWLVSPSSKCSSACLQIHHTAGKCSENTTEIGARMGKE